MILISKARISRVKNGYFCLYKLKVAFFGIAKGNYRNKKEETVNLKTLWWQHTNILKVLRS
jgi:hypothetical protein